MDVGTLERSGFKVDIKWKREVETDVRKMRLAGFCVGYHALGQASYLGDLPAVLSVQPSASFTHPTPVKGFSHSSPGMLLERRGGQVI